MKAAKLLAVFLVVGMVTGVRAEEKKGEANKEKLVGTWEATKTDEGTTQVGTTVTFTKEGKYRLVMKKEDKESSLEGTYTVKGDQLLAVRKAKDKEQKRTFTIKKLTATELTLEDEKGKKAEFKKKS